MDWDLQGREWGFMRTDGPLAASLAANIVPIIAKPRAPDRDPKVLGSGFIVSTQAGQALCITAAHVIDYARDVLDLPSRHRSSVAPGFERQEEMDTALTAACARRELLAHIVIDGKPDFATISEGFWIRPLDVGVLVLESNLFTSATPALTINSDFFPEPGTRVFALGAHATKIDVVGAHEKGRILRVAPAIEGRAGTIRALHHRDMFATSCVYELTLSIPPGMSGGPVLLSPEHGEAMQVIAFASHDIAPKETVDDCSSPGRGYALPISLTYFLSLVGETPGSLLRLARAQRIRDLGRTWPELEVVEEGERVKFKRRDDDGTLYDLPGSSEPPVS
jgi:hypothetical protein